MRVAGKVVSFIQKLGVKIWDLVGTPLFCLTLFLGKEWTGNCCVPYLAHQCAYILLYESGQYPEQGNDKVYHLGNGHDGDNREGCALLEKRGAQFSGMLCFTNVRSLFCGVQFDCIFI